MSIFQSKFSRGQFSGQAFLIDLDTWRKSPLQSNRLSILMVGKFSIRTFLYDDKDAFFYCEPFFQGELGGEGLDSIEVWLRWGYSIDLKGGFPIEIKTEIRYHIICCYGSWLLS